MRKILRGDHGHIFSFYSFYSICSICSIYSMYFVYSTYPIIYRNVNRSSSPKFACCYVDTVNFVPSKCFPENITGTFKVLPIVCITDDATCGSKISPFFNRFINPTVDENWGCPPVWSAAKMLPQMINQPDFQARLDPDSSTSPGLAECALSLNVVPTLCVKHQLWGCSLLGNTCCISNQDRWQSSAC